MPQGASTKIFSSSDSEFNFVSDSEKKLLGGVWTGGARIDNRSVGHLEMLKILEPSPIVTFYNIFGPQ